MTRRNTWESYRQIATQTASPNQLVLMLYDGAIRFLERARLGFLEEDPLEYNRTINNNVLRAQDIINELNRSLDMSKGGEFSTNMRRLYTYLDRRLQESNERKDEEAIKEVINRVTVLRDAWAQMLESQKAVRTPVAASDSLSACV
jgi:flagellar protein FliS